MAAAGDPILASDINTHIGYGELTGDSSSTSGTTELSVLNLAVNLVSGRKYRVEWSGSVAASVAGDCYYVRIRQDSVSGTEMNLAQIYCDTTGTVGFEGYTKAMYTAAATGSKTFHVTVTRQDGTGVAFMTGRTTRPSSITVTLINEA